VRLELRETLFGLSLSVFACSNSVVVNGWEERRIFNSVFCQLEGKKSSERQLYTLGLYMYVY
jgi:hypothetical protein